MKHTLRNDLSTLAEDIGVLLSATAETADETVAEARKRLSVVAKDARKTYSHLKEMAVTRAKAAGQGVREHPYATICGALAAGALLALIMTRGHRER
jgi:ElaB/YqjD/DUF883 family membrane-anchored ribosome-binding protein